MLFHNVLSASALGLFLKLLLFVATFFWLIADYSIFVLCSSPAAFASVQLPVSFAMNCPSGELPADFPWSLELQHQLR